MRPNEGRLQTAEHVLSHLLEHREPPAKVVIAKFSDDSGLLEVSCADDIRLLDLAKLQQEVSSVIGLHLAVKQCILKRVEAEKFFDLSRLPAFVTDVRVVEIEGFDTTPCKDPHVKNTSEIGVFTLLGIKRVGKDRYRFAFQVE